MNTPVPGPPPPRLAHGGPQLPPVDSKDNPQNTITRVGQFFVSSEDQSLVSVNKRTRALQ